MVVSLAMRSLSTIPPFLTLDTGGADPTMTRLWGTSGDLQISIDACISSMQLHSYLGISKQGIASVLRSAGNADCHVILRGGSNGPNYDQYDVADATIGDHKLAPPPKSVPEMTEALLRQLQTPSKQQKGAGPAPSKQQKDTDSSPCTKPNLLKRPASAMEISEVLEYPGTGDSAPKFYKKATIYTSSTLGCWRVKAKLGDKLDKSFSFKGNTKDPKKVWSQVVKHLIELNP